MADTKTSAETLGSTPVDADYFRGVQASDTSNKRWTFTLVAAWVIAKFKASQAAVLTGTNDTTFVTPLTRAGTRGGFSANKNSVDQTGVANSTWTKVTLGTEGYDVGAYYDNAQSRWTPPAGLVDITARLQATTNMLATTTLFLGIYKNGALFRALPCLPQAAANANAIINIKDQANGTDFYELYVNPVGTSGSAAATVAGDTATTWWCGTWLG